MSERPQPETDPRFPSGKWVGFWIQKHPPIGRQPTELYLTFSDGVLQGEGRDIVGKYTVRGRYNLADGRCHWTKHYVGKHEVYYEGFNEGKGIWGTWSIRARPDTVEVRGGFHIWPEEMPDPSEHTLKEEAEVPAELVLS
jgi:hypothetical protein